MYVLIGSNSFLGTYVTSYLLENTQADILAVSRSGQSLFDSSRVIPVQADITDRDAVLRTIDIYSRWGQADIFFFAAVHNPDVIFRDPAAARRVNIDALDSFTRDAAGTFGRLIFSSSDVVYGESADGRAPFIESDLPSPINEYGRQKAEAESIILASGGSVLRYSVLLGPGAPAHKVHFYDKLVKVIRDGTPYELLSDFRRHPLSYAHAAELTVRLCETDPPCPDIINVCSDTLMSKYDIGIDIAGRLGLSAEHLSRSYIADADYFLDRRAHDIRLDNGLLKSVLGLKSVGPTQSLK